MPNLIVIDTASALCQVALLKDGLISSLQSADRRQHAQRLLPMVAELLQQGELSPAELNAIAVVVGPGSFTGLRIGIGAAQGLAYAAGVPLLPVSSLAVLAMAAVSKLGQPYILVSTLARDREVYFAAYRQSQTLGVELVGAEQVTAVDRLQIEFQSDVAQQWIAVGDGWRYRNELTNGLDAVVVRAASEVVSSTEAVCQLAALAFAQGLALPPEQVQPNYVKVQMDYAH